MQLAFGWYNIIELLFCLAVLWMGIRDLQGKDPLIHTFFNQYDRDPEYRAMWQKKNGVWWKPCSRPFYLGRSRRALK